MASPTYLEISSGEGSSIWEGAIVMDHVGRRAVVGAGGRVVREVPGGAPVVGDPARQTGSSGNERLDGWPSAGSAAFDQ